jgi:hypothetical protein
MRSDAQKPPGGGGGAGSKGKLGGKCKAGGGGGGAGAVGGVSRSEGGGGASVWVAMETRDGGGHALGGGGVPPPLTATHTLTPPESDSSPTSVGQSKKRVKFVSLSELPEAESPQPAAQVEP